MTLVSACADPAHEQAGAGVQPVLRRLEQNARRWRLWFSSWIYEVAGPRYALICFATRVETRSAPDSDIAIIPYMGCSTRFNRGRGARWVLDGN